MPLLHFLGGILLGFLAAYLEVGRDRCNAAYIMNPLGAASCSGIIFKVGFKHGVFRRTEVKACLQSLLVAEWRTCPQTLAEKYLIPSNNGREG